MPLSKPMSADELEALVTQGPWPMSTIVALRNEAPRLIAVLRAAEAMVLSADANGDPQGWHIDNLRAALARLTVPRDKR